ncbi:MAG: hypothetical protein QXX95_05080 [Nitrososphaerales archaeon]
MIKGPIEVPLSFRIDYRYETLWHENFGIRNRWRDVEIIKAKLKKFYNNFYTIQP